MAEQRPELNFIGIEVHRAGVGSLVADLQEKNIKNVRIVAHDAVEVFKQQFSEASLAGIQIFFPDPWHKKKHHKRRLIQPNFIQLIASRLRVGGFIHCATDWENYAEQIQAVLEAEKSFSNSQSEGGYSPRPESRPLTKFELRGQRLGHGVWDLIYLKN
jgi:tRNA (guanine-N7-)-methyltransferase